MLIRVLSKIWNQLMGTPATLAPGSAAPDFALPDRQGVIHSLNEIKGDFTVLFFYPKDDTPGCTIEANEFNAQLEQFRAEKISVVGISGGDNKTKEKFCAKFGLTLPMLSDTDFSVATAYGVYGEKKFMGKTFNGIHRVTYVLDRAAKVLKVFDKVSPEGHAQEVFKYIKSAPRT